MNLKVEYGPVGLIWDNRKIHLPKKFALIVDLLLKRDRVHARCIGVSTKSLTVYMSELRKILRLYEIPLIIRTNYADETYSLVKGRENGADHDSSAEHSENICSG